MKKLKEKLKVKNKKKFIFLLTILFVVACSTLIIMIKLNNINKTQPKSVKITNNITGTNNGVIKKQDNKDILIKSIQEKNAILQDNIVLLNNKIEAINAEIEYLKEYISKIENQNPIYNEKNLQVMVLLNKIQQLYYTNKNFDKELDYLKSLLINKNHLIETVLKLENYKVSTNDLKLITIVFKEEYKTNLLSKNKNNNIFKSIINENIKIRKLNNEGGQGANNILINDMEDAINAGNYNLVVELILQNNYQNTVFKKTYNIAQRISNFDKIIDDLTREVVNF
ncbi:MAG: hypothetical protein J6C50_02995 [Rickettsiales bacterium]|nr:hypothetical protein [Rickettsiales bacterium]